MDEKFNFKRKCISNLIRTVKITGISMALGVAGYIYYDEKNLDEFIYQGKEVPKEFNDLCYENSFIYSRLPEPSEMTKESLDIHVQVYRNLHQNGCVNYQTKSFLSKARKYYN